jgi:hypothetical protein
MKHKQIIEAFGGVRYLQRALKQKNHTTVQAWYYANDKQGKIPRWHWQKVVDASKQKRFKFKLKLSDFEG